MNLRVAVYSSLIMLAACAQAPVRYNPAPAPVPPPATRTIPPPPIATPETITSANAKIVGKSRDNLWRSVTAALSQSRFAITSVDYKTGVMQLRYAGDPRNYIDCGRVNSKVGERTFDFPAASAFQQYQILSQGKIFNVDRRMNLETQIALSLQPLDAARTSARADTRYAVSRDQYVTPVAGGSPFNASDSVSFMFNESATFPNAATRCSATMQLETELMQLVR